MQATLQRTICAQVSRTYVRYLAAGILLLSLMSLQMMSIAQKSAFRIQPKFRFHNMRSEKTITLRMPQQDVGRCNLFHSSQLLSSDGSCHRDHRVFFLVNEKQDSVFIPHLRRRKTIVASMAVGIAGGSLIALNELWYKDYPRSSFHFFNDNDEWLQMDKAGHAMTTYTIGRLGYDVLRWSGYNMKRAAWTSAIAGLAYLSVVEVLDGKSAAWGFSVGDMVANCFGTTAFLSQQLLWGEQRIVLKYSYHSSPFAAMNPSLLGRNFQQRILKDYNAQTYWSSINIHSFLASDAVFPKWINVAFGYGATGMTRAKNDVRDVNNFQRMREFYFSFDADLSRVRWPKKWMRITAKVIGVIKIPLPTIRVQENGNVKVIALY